VEQLFNSILALAFRFRPQHRALHDGRAQVIADTGPFRAQRVPYAVVLSGPGDRAVGSRKQRIIIHGLG